MSAASSSNPPIVTRGVLTPPAEGESPNLSSYKTLIDTISWSFATTGHEKEAKEIAGISGYILGFFPGAEWGPTEPGDAFYPHQMKLLSGSLVCGWLSFGAAHGKVWVYVGGTGLRVRRDRGLTDESLTEIGELDGVKITRCDIALDLYRHQDFSVSQSMKAHKRGGYTCHRAPRAPYEETRKSSSRAPGYPFARTHYVGRKQSGKQCRIYDKGLKTLAGMTAEEYAVFQANGSIAVVHSSPVPAGAKIEEWTRIELELHDDKYKPIPTDIIHKRDEYFAGGYPILATLLDKTDGVRPTYLPREEDVEIARLIKACKESYGGMIYALKNHERWKLTDSQIIDYIIGDKMASRLKLDSELPSGGEVLQ